MKRQVFTMSVFAVRLLIPLPTWATAGNLDPTFGNGGVVVQNELTDLDALVLQPDGKLVGIGTANAGGLTLARYNSDGSLDAAFGNGGLVTTPQIGAGLRLVLQSDGRLVAGGIAWSDNVYAHFAVARYNANGSLDPTFGNGGILIAPYSSDSDFLNAIALAPDGKLIALGYSNILKQPAGKSSYYLEQLLLTRINADGTLDESFGTGGWVTKRMADYDYGESAAVQPDGRIVVADFSCRDGQTTYCRGLALRYQVSGKLDLSFGTRGIAEVPTGTFGSAIDSVHLRSDGTIVVLGGPSDPSGGVGVTRFTAEGALDPSFGSGGVAHAARHFGAQTMIQRPDGSLLVAGHSFPAVFDGSADFALMRFTESGILDERFGNDGVASTRLSSYDLATALVTQPDNKVVAAGLETRPDGRGFVAVVARFVDGQCGNGTLEPGEECDDGNVVNGDGCDANCTVTRCGNTVTSSAEECDDGNQQNDDACKNDCTLNVCGDGVVRTGVEVCDDGNSIDDDGCSNSCQRTRCGDGVRDPSEECDDGNTTNGDGCDANCLVEQCGNGRVEGGEQCDSGTLTGDAVCAAACHWALEYDAVLRPVNPLTVKLNAGHDELTRYVSVFLDAGGGHQIPAGHTVQLTAADGDCPAGTIISTSDPITFVADTARVFIHVSRTAFSNATATTPQRCTLAFTAHLAPQDVYDPNPENNSVSLELNVFDLSSVEMSQAGSFSLDSVKPLSAKIARGAAQISKTVKLNVKTTTPDPTQTIAITAQDGTCPSGTVGSPTPSSLTLARRHTRVWLPLTVRSAAFQSRARNSPARCTAVVTATSSGGTQQTTRINVDVMDSNDL
jgi:uncharacterized delta-60 repeat protein